MRFLKVIAMSSLLFVGCAHAIKTVGDLSVGQDYQTVGAPKAELQQCKLKLQNIITVMPTEMGPIPLEAVGEETQVCGEIDCRASLGPDAKGFSCIPFSDLQSSKSE